MEEMSAEDAADHLLAGFMDASAEIATLQVEVSRLRDIIIAAFEDLRDGDGTGAYAILRTAAMAFPSVPQAPSQ